MAHLKFCLEARNSNQTVDLYFDRYDDGICMTMTGTKDDVPFQVDFSPITTFEAKQLAAFISHVADNEGRDEQPGSSAEIACLRTALKQIANGDGVYGAQAHEYKQIARRALASHASETNAVVSQYQPKVELKPSASQEE